MRLIQPKQPTFWLLVVLNGLTAALVWIVQNRELVWFVHLIIALFAVVNALLCLWLMVVLLREPPAKQNSALQPTQAQPDIHES